MAAAAQVPVVADLSTSGSSNLFRESGMSQDPAKLVEQLSGSDPVLLTGEAAVLPRQQRDQVSPSSNVRVEILDLATAPNPRPSRVLFGGLQDPALQVRRAIPLDVWLEESTVLVRWDEIDEFGAGENLSCALDDFSHTLRDLYHHLYAQDVTPGADLLHVKRVLGEHIEPRAK
ncbi:MAG: hypothetical protein WBM24_16600 [Candidatus Sulfotelmatobacter sp.]